MGKESQVEGEKLVWVMGSKGEYIVGKIVQEEESKVVVDLEGKKTVHLKAEVQKANPPKFDLVENMAHLSYLNEPSILHNLHQRYLSDMQYTYSGLFLVAVNPYKSMPIYGKEHVNKYSQVKKREEAPPHIYAVASEAYHLMRNTKKPQTILITGESGAGKTENTKHAIAFLTKISESHENNRQLLEEKLLLTNPLLEAFGNAQTERNDNSSRFGKFIRIDFGFNGEIIGASVERYLLETSRVTKQTPGERNYHIFYSLVETADPAYLATLKLTKNRKYRIIPKIPGKSIPFSEVQHAMDVLGIPEKEKEKIFRVLAAIIHLGEVSFEESSSSPKESAGGRDASGARGVWLSPEGEEFLKNVAYLLEIKYEDILEVLQRPKIKAGNEVVAHGRTAEEINFTTASLCKVMYERVFNLVISLVNFSLQSPAKGSSYIGVLDIAGFEILDKNGFEQLCINYTNEKLQQFFNHIMFVLEQETYLNEGLEWSMIDFGLDLQPTIDLLETKDTGVFSLLDEECVVPGGTDQRLFEKIVSSWSKHPKFTASKFNNGFSVEHYAGFVKYNEPGWVAKNKDPLDEAVASLFLGPKGPIPETPAVFGASKPFTRFRTVAQRHKQQLKDLLTLLYTTTPHFVRCILPNTEKTPGNFVTSRVLHQLRCNGVLEGVRISRKGFPTRVPFGEFVLRYGLLGKSPREGFPPSEKGVRSLLNELQVPPSLYQLGRTLLFLRQGVLADLEELRNVRLSGLVIEMQRRLRAILAQNQERIDNERADAVLVVQKNVKAFASVREWGWWRLCMKIRPLLEVRKAECEIKSREVVIESQRREIEELKEQKRKIASEHSAEVHELQKSLSVSEEERERLEIETRALQKENSALAEDATASQKASAKLAVQNDALKRELEEQSAKIEQEHREAASESEAKALAEISSLRKRLSEAEESERRYKTALDESELRMELANHEKEILAQEQRALEERSKKQAMEIEELQNRVETAESKRYSAEVTMKHAESEVERLRKSLVFEKEKLAKLDDAFKRASTAPPPVVQMPVQDNSKEINQLREALEREKEIAEIRKEENEDLKRQYIDLVDHKLGAMVSSQEELSAEINRMNSTAANLQIQLAQSEENVSALVKAKEEAMCQRAKEAEKRRAAESALAKKNSSELEHKRAAAQLKAENNALKEELKGLARKGAEEPVVKIEGEIVQEVLHAVEVLKELVGYVEKVDHNVASATDALEMYRKEVEKLTEEVMQLEHTRSISVAALVRKDKEVGELKESLEWTGQQMSLLVKEKKTLIEETENEIQGQRERFEKEQEEAEDLRKTTENEKKKLLKTVKEKDREISSLRTSLEESKFLQKSLETAKNDASKHLEELESFKESVQKTMKQLQNEREKEKERTSILKISSESCSSSLLRAESLLAKSLQREAELKDAIKQLEERLLISTMKEKELALNTRSLSVELSSLKSLASHERS